MSVVPMGLLLETGVHFGHQTKRWNPKMKEYIFTARDGIYIIDLHKTAKKIEEAYNALYKIAENGGKALFVGTRKQASDAIKEEAIRSNSFYVNERWLGGTLTNFTTIRKRVRRLDEIEKMEKDGIFDVLPKKEVVKLKKEYNKLNKVLGGIRDMQKLPNVLFIVDPIKEEIAIREARKLNIPVIGIVDTNCDPDMVDYVIPGNDDAIRAIKLITSVMANAINSATGGPLVEYSYSNIKENKEEIMQKALETVRPKSEPSKRFDRYNKRRSSRKRKIKRTKLPAKNEKPNEIKKNKENKEEQIKVEKPKVQTTPKETVEKPKQDVNVDLSKLTVVKLREKAKAKNIKGYSTMRKAELIEALK